MREGSTNTESMGKGDLPFDRGNRPSTPTIGGSTAHGQRVDISPTELGFGGLDDLFVVAG
jgi:hypothetical protein